MPWYAEVVETRWEKYILFYEAGRPLKCGVRRWKRAKRYFTVPVYDYWSGPSLWRKTILKWVETYGERIGRHEDKNPWSRVKPVHTVYRVPGKVVEAASELKRAVEGNWGTYMMLVRRYRDALENPEKAADALVLVRMIRGI